jgi:hypothetical protein
MNIVRLGVADDSDALHRVFEIAKAAGVTVLPEDGSGVAGYPFSVDAREWARVRAALTASHLFRSGDLRVFLHELPIPRDRPMTKEDLAAIGSWRLALRAQEGSARTNTFE